MFRRNRGDTGVLVGDNKVYSYSGAPSEIHSAVGNNTGNLCWSGGAAAVISAQTSTVHSLDILRAKLTLLQCVVCAHARERWSERASENERGVLSEGKQAEEHATPTLETKATVSSVSSDCGREAEAGRVDTV